MQPDRVLFLDSYTDPTFKSISSPEIGYGISCASAIKGGLRAEDLSIIECSPAISEHQSKLDWIYGCYESLNALSPTKRDIVFIFHSLIHFPGEVRRLINHHTRIGCPIIGYTHGSHWDPTDTIRRSSNPGLVFQDLANLMSYDRLLIVSEYYRKLIRKEISVLGSLVTERFDEISRVVGLPIDTDSIDSMADYNRKSIAGNKVRIVFNHALRSPKRPELALYVIEKILTNCDNCTVDITRSFDKGSPLEIEFKRLLEKFNDRIVCHGTLSLNDYYRLLWNCDIQFSTAAHESFGVATVEAMYTGSACFTPNALSYPEITGGIGNYNSLDELVDLVRKAVFSVEYRVEIAELQRKNVARFTPKVIAKRIKSVIEELHL